MGLQFGMSAVQSGKRVMQTSNEPTLTANSTKAKFTLAAAVTRIMGLIPGDNVQFVSNIADIDAAIAERDADVMAWCEETMLSSVQKLLALLLSRLSVNTVSVKVFPCSRRTEKSNLQVFV